MAWKSWAERFQPIYRPINQEENNSEKGENHDSNPPKRRHFGKLFITSHILLFALYLTSIFFIWRREPSNKKCVFKLSTPSPALPVISYLEPHHLDAEIVQTNIYRGIPSPQIDAAWLRIGLGTPGIRLNEDDLKKLNKTDTPLRPLHKIPEEYGGGYLGMLEVFHLLHCLDSLRKATWPEYYTEELETQGYTAVRAHTGIFLQENGMNLRQNKRLIRDTDHCIDMLREVIMCTADVTPLTFYDDLSQPERKLPMPDFNTLHTCRNFEEVLEWGYNGERSVEWDEMGLDLGEEDHVGRR